MLTEHEKEIIEKHIRDCQTTPGITSSVKIYNCTKAKISDTFFNNSIANIHNNRKKYDEYLEYLSKKINIGGDSGEE